MQLVFNIRATSILYFFLLENKGNGVWMIPVNVCHLLPACFIKADCPFEIVDVDENTLAMDEEKVVQNLVKKPDKYSGILTVRNYGEDLPRSSFFSKIKKINPSIKIVDDACLSFPDFDKQILKEVDLELYSTGYSKPVDIGYGGFGKLQSNYHLEIKGHLEFDESALIDMNKYWFNISKSYKSQLKFQEFNSNWLQSQSIDYLKYIEEVNKSLLEAKSHKAKLNKIYDELLSSNIKEKRLSSNWRYNIRLANPRYVLEKINEEGLFASQHYLPINKVFDDTSCPKWEKNYNSILNLFNDYRFNEEKATQCCKIINYYAKIIND